MKYMMDTDDVANKLKANFTLVAVVVKVSAWVGGSFARVPAASGVLLSGVICLLGLLGVVGLLA